MTIDGEHVARQALTRLPIYTTAQVRDARMARLPGLTNKIFRVAIGEERVCLRIPGAGTAAIIDRRAEETNTRAAAKAGVAPELLYFGADGVMVTRFVDDALPLSAARFRAVPGAVDRAARALRSLHDNASPFAAAFDAFASAANYIALLRRRGADLPPGREAILREADAVQRALDARPRPLRPCHCDPTGANLLDTGERVWIVDWEYSGMNDPTWDLAYLSLQADFEPAQDRRLLHAYFDRTALAAEAACVAVQKAPCELLSALWALVQHSAGNDAADFLGYADRAFRDCGDRMRAPEFAENLELVRRG